MPADRIEEQLQQLLRALYGENANAVPGLVARVGEIQSSLRQMADEQQRWHEEQRDWRERTERRLDMLERPKPIIVTERAVYISGAVITLTLGVLLLWVLLLNGRFG
jgi:hypothetical protein